MCSYLVTVKVADSWPKENLFLWILSLATLAVLKFRTQYFLLPCSDLRWTDFESNQRQTTTDRSESLNSAVTPKCLIVKERTKQNKTKQKKVNKDLEHCNDLKLNRCILQKSVVTWAAALFDDHVWKLGDFHLSSTATFRQVHDRQRRSFRHNARERIAAIVSLASRRASSSALVSIVAGRLYDPSIRPGQLAEVDEPRFAATLSSSWIGRNSAVVRSANEDTCVSCSSVVARPVPGGIRGQWSPNFLFPPNFVVPRKLFIKTYK